MLSIIKPRGDIKSNWESANPILRMREWGIEWETTVGVGEVKIKIGDGITPWLTLDYVLVNDVTKKIVKTFATVTTENPELTEGSSMDVLWATVKKKFEFLNQKVTDISENGDIDLTEVDLPTFTDYTTDDTTMPDARTAINNITSNIKVPAFISNAKAALRGLITLGEMRSLLVNSGLTTESGKYFLDAAYGKTLADQISQLNSSTVLWSGTLTFEEDKTITLSDSLTNYKYIDIYAHDGGGDYPINTFEANKTSFCLRYFNMSNSLTNISITFDEMALVKISNTVLGINNDGWVRLRWSGEAGESAVKSITTADIKKIVGRNI